MLEASGGAASSSPQPSKGRKRTAIDASLGASDARHNRRRVVHLQAYAGDMSSAAAVQQQQQQQQQQQVSNDPAAHHFDNILDTLASISQPAADAAAAAKRSSRVRDQGMHDDEQADIAALLGLRGQPADFDAMDSNDENVEVNAVNQHEVPGDEQEDSTM